MKRRYFSSGLAGLAGCARDPRPRLNVYNWSAYVAPETIPNFEAEFGVRVRYATYESNEEMLAKVLTGNSGWDVVFPTHNRLEPMRENGLLAPLRPRVAAQPGQPGRALSRAGLGPGAGSGACRTCGTAPGSSTTGSLQPPPARWADLWSATSKGRLTMLDDPEDMLGACLKKLGLSFSATAPGRTARARNRRRSRRSRCCAPT